MKIAFFIGPYPKFSETFVVHQYKSFVAAGHDVCIFAEELLDPVIGPIRLEQMPANPLSRLFGLLCALFRADLSLSLPLLRSLNLFRFGLDALSLRLAWSVWRAGANDSFDIVYAHFGAHGRRAALLLAVGAIEGKLVTAMHGEDIGSYPRRFRGNIYAPLFATGDLFLAISDYGLRKLALLGCPVDRIQIQRMGVDTEIFLPACHSRPMLRIVTIARFVACKGLHTALSALARLKFPFEYRLVGDGPLHAELIQAAEALCIQNNVSFCGVKSSTQVRNELQDADIFLLSSETAANGDEEGIPVALMEAMACGLPVVSTHHSGIPELIEDGTEGILVQEGDVSALAVALERLAADPALRQTMGKLGRERILRQYNSASLDRQLLSTLEGLL